MAELTTRQSRFPRPGMNPILIKELRSRMRGPRAFLILTGFLLLLSGVAFFFYKAIAQVAQFSGGPTPVSVTIGVSMFLGIVFFELFLVAFITPALTAGTISGEREALTYEMLMATPLRPSSILVGKMVAAMSYVFLLIFAAIPMLSLVFIFGGVTLRDMLVTLLVLAATAITFGTVGLFWSALLGKTARATVMSYLTLLGFIIGPFVIGIMWSIVYQQTPPPAFSYLNPFTATASVISFGPDQGFGFFGGPLYFLFGLLTGGGFGMGGPPVSLAHPAWHWTLAAYALVTLVLGVAALLLVRPVGRRRVTAPQVGLAVMLLGLYLGTMVLLFDRGEVRQIWQSPDGPRPLIERNW